MGRDNISDFGRLVDGYVRECIDENDEVLQQRCAEAGKAAAKRLKQESRKRSGAYAKGWKSSVQADETGVEVTVHNTRHQLTHLLENDHEVKNQTGKSYGKAKGDRVISKVAERVGREFEAGGGAQ